MIYFMSHVLQFLKFEKERNILNTKIVLALYCQSQKQLHNRCCTSLYPTPIFLLLNEAPPCSATTSSISYKLLAQNSVTFHYQSTRDHSQADRANRQHYAVKRTHQQHNSSPKWLQQLPQRKTHLSGVERGTDLFSKLRS